LLALFEMAFLEKFHSMLAVTDDSAKTCNQWPYGSLIIGSPVDVAAVISLLGKSKLGDLFKSKALCVKKYIDKQIGVIA
jgi:hypothetical protein